LTIGIRPEAMRIGAGACTVPCKFRRRENLGSESILHFELAATPAVPVLCKVGNDVPIPEGQTTLAFDPRDCHVFDETGRRVTLGTERRSSDNGLRRVGEAR
jgi:multiple sugar transport system ATP-binding protein